MTIEHSTISFGEIHPVANWAVTVGGVAALGGIPVGDGDIGKVAWVAGVGHYVLASTAPTVWESLGVTITDMTYDTQSATLSITLSDGTTHSVVIVAGLSESEVNELIADALDDYDDGIKTYIGNSITDALGALTTANIPDSTNRRYVSDAQLAVLGNTSGTNSGDETQASIKTKIGAASAAQDGYLTSTDWSTFNSKEPAITNGTTGQYVRGNKTLGTLDTDAVTETASRVFLSPAQKTVATQAASNTVNGYLSSADWSTFNSKQAALADVITANTYGNSTQYPVITFNAKGIATGVTLQTVPTPTFTDATFSVQKNGSPSITATWSLTALTASRVHTYPDKAINFGTLSSVATTDSNTLSGTGTRILGGSSNIVSGTGVVAVGCNGCDLSMYTNKVIAIGLQGTTNSYAVAPRQAILLGSSALTTSIFNISGAHAAALGVIQCVYSDICQANGATYNATLDGVNTPSSTNCIKLMPSATALSSAVIDLDFIIVVGDNMSGALLAPRRTVFAKRRVYVVYAFNASDAGEFNSSVEVIGTDTSVGSAATGTVTVGVTVDSANNRLIPTVSATSGSKQTLFQFGVRSTAHYNRNV